MIRLLAALLSLLLVIEPASAAVVQITVKDAAGTTRNMNVTTNSDITGNLDFNQVICDQAAGTTCASVGTAGSPSTNALTVQAVTLGHGTAANAMRVELPTDGTGVVGLAAGTQVIGHVIVDSGTVTTVSTVTNLAQMNGAALLMGNGVTGTGSQRVTIASDNTAFTVNAAQSGTWTVQPGNTPNSTPWLMSPSTGGNTAAVKAASTAPVATDPALVVSISPNSVNANGQATMANSAPVAIASNQSTVPVGLQAIATGGWTPKWVLAANSDNATSLKGSAGTVHAVQVFGIGAAPAYLKFYNKATSPTCGSDTIVKQIMIPAASTAANGAGAVAIVLDTAFSTGIAYCVVTGITAADDTSVAASTFVINIDWL